MAPRKSKQRVIANGEMLVTKFPTAGRCRHCGQTVLVGLLWGMDCKYDPYPLNEWGELEAKMRGAKTFWMDHPQFRYRTTSMIRNELVPRFGGIVREHVCGAPIPASEYLATLKTREDKYDGPCPF